LLDNIGNGKRFARAGYAQQGLVGIAVIYTFNQLAYSAGLVAGGLVLRG